jgi:hypothetical protein
MRAGHVPALSCSLKIKSIPVNFGLLSQARTVLRVLP